MNFADRLRNARERSALSQKSLAESLGVAQTAVSSWERGRTEPSRQMTARIAEALGCAVAELELGVQVPAAAPAQKRVLLIVGGGIAAYKTPELVRQLEKRGVAARVILTAAGAQFVTPLALSSLTHEEVFTELFDLTAEAKMGHIELSRSADLVVVAPATADLMAKAAHGLANDLASTALLATDKAILMAPAMNVRMWEAPATQRNLKTLQADGVGFIGPDAGAMACGEYGPGRMAEPEVIADAVLAALTPRPAPLKGKHIVLTAGPTIEPIDPVRFLSNRSSGAQGYAIADALAALGAKVTLVSGPVRCPPAERAVVVQSVETALEMLAAVEAALPADAFISVAAVADWRPASAAEQKLKLKQQDAAPTLTLLENPDILATIAHGPRRPALVIGFAAETHDVLAHAAEKRMRKGCDWIIANDVSGDVMGGTRNTVSLVTQAGAEHWPLLDKTEVARRLAERIAQALGPTAPARRGSSAPADQARP
jgi:phosphopantothenoylcysteine decarboxylase / phosphopantothenate---cysteine ligase